MVKKRTLYIDHEIDKAIAHQAIEEEIGYSRIAEKAFQLYLKTVKKEKEAKKEGMLVV
jgi:hypothetical protein